MKEFSSFLTELLGENKGVNMLLIRQMQAWLKPLSKLATNPIIGVTNLLFDKINIHDSGRVSWDGYI